VTYRKYVGKTAGLKLVGVPSGR